MLKFRATFLVRPEVPGLVPDVLGSGSSGGWPEVQGVVEKGGGQGGFWGKLSV